jgi:hypothetical protein
LHIFHTFDFHSYILLHLFPLFSLLGTSHGTWHATGGYYPTTTCNYGAGGSGISGGTSVDAMYHHHHSHHQTNVAASYSPQESAAAAAVNDHHSLGWNKAHKDVTTAATWNPDNYS